MTPGIPGLVLTTVYYLVLVVAMPFVVLVRRQRAQPTQARAAAVVWALTAACVGVGWLLWRWVGV